MWLVLIRVLVLVLLAHSGWVYAPFPERWIGLTIGVLAALGLMALEQKLRSVPGHNMVGALIGGVIGLFGARMVWGALDGLDIIGEHFVHALVVVFLGYMGVVIGGQKGEWFEPARIIAAFRDSSRLHQYKILDTSVIIDGRIADICETGFLEGTLVAPQFVLRELQQVADSSDSLKRNRGRRGLDILQKMQKMSNVAVQIVETDFPDIREVDLKLIELARKLGGKIVTNDFNLNKVAQLRGVPVLNINELANSLKPVVLPGELMKVFIIKEGKEQGQGVGYLDDGTMVVVDQAKKALGKTIDVSVSSVLQTTAGKMIFCRWPDAAAFVEEPRRDSRVGDRRDLVRNGRDLRGQERREIERRDGERPGLAPIPPSSMPGPHGAGLHGGSAVSAPAGASEERVSEAHTEPHAEASVAGAAPLASGLLDRPAVKAE
jgi:uncharacterized protein YacL